MRTVMSKLMPKGLISVLMTSLAIDYCEPAFANMPFHKSEEIDPYTLCAQYSLNSV